MMERELKKSEAAADKKSTLLPKMDPFGRTGESSFRPSPLDRGGLMAENERRPLAAAAETKGEENAPGSTVSPLAETETEGAVWSDREPRPLNEPPPVQPKKAPGNGADAFTQGGGGSSSALSTLPPASAGSPLPDQVRDGMEQALGADFSTVRVHQGEAATNLGARAFTRGEEVHFAPGQYQPDTPAGQELLGHELTHVVQQREGRVQSVPQTKGAGVNADPALEAEADERGARAAASLSTRGQDGVSAQNSLGPEETAGPSGAAVIQLSKDDGTDTEEKAEGSEQQSKEEGPSLGEPESKPQEEGNEETRKADQQEDKEQGEQEQGDKEQGEQEQEDKEQGEQEEGDRQESEPKADMGKLDALRTALDNKKTKQKELLTLLQGMNVAERKLVAGDETLKNSLLSKLGKKNKQQALFLLATTLEERVAALQTNKKDLQAFLKGLTPEEKEKILKDNNLLNILKKLSTNDAIGFLAGTTKSLSARLTLLLDHWKLGSNKTFALISSASNADRVAVLSNAELRQKIEALLGGKKFQKVVELFLIAGLALSNADAISEAYSLMDEASKKKLAKDSLLDKILGVIPVSKKNAILDELFALSNKKLPTMLTLFEKRFGISPGSGNDKKAKAWMTAAGVKEATWKPNGLQRVYNLFKKLPPSHMTNVTHLMVHDNKTGGGTSGFAASNAPYISIAYDEKKADIKETGDYTNEGDKMRGMYALDTTVAHELAHKVDTGRKYSGKAAFRRLAGWQSYPVPARAGQLVTDMEAAMNDALGTENLTDDEKRLARRGAQLSIEARRGTVVAMADDLKRSYQEEGVPFDGGNQVRKLSRLFRAVGKSNLYRHVVLANANQAPWYSEPFSYLPNKQFHEAYPAEWWSYDNAGRTHNLSIYQFRDPGEYFAELYATYFGTTPPGQKVPAPLKAWFEGEGLHQG